LFKTPSFSIPNTPLSTSAYVLTFSPTGGQVGYALASAVGGGGTVTSFSYTNNAYISGVTTNATTTPQLSLSPSAKP